jgi:hypothetical protein
LEGLEWVWHHLALEPAGGYLGVLTQCSVGYMAILF